MGNNLCQNEILIETISKESTQSFRRKNKKLKSKSIFSKSAEELA